MVVPKNWICRYLIVLMTSINHIKTENSEIFNITNLERNQGLYFESHGIVSTSTSNWELVLSVDTSKIDTKYRLLMSQYYAMESVCKQLTHNFGSTEIFNVCEYFSEQFSKATIPHIYEIQANHRNVMAAIVHNEETENRVRRGIGQSVKNIAKILYGIASKVDIEFIFSQILELVKRKVSNVNLETKQTRIVQMETIDSHNITKKMSEHQQQLEKNLEFLKQQLNETIQNINKIALKERLLEQAFLFEVVLNQFAYETQNLISIINTALDGKIHISVITPNQLLSELKEIKTNLPTGSALPLGINPTSLTDLFKVSDTTIFIKDSYLVFSVAIPLISDSVYRIYHPIPLPIPYNGDSFILIDQEMGYLAISTDEQRFFFLNPEQWKMCILLKSARICKVEQPIHSRVGSDSCEVSILTGPRISDTCKVEIITSKTSFWKRLEKTNAWLFFTRSESLTITCSNPSQNRRLDISGIGRLSTSSACEIHTLTSVLVPFKENSRDVFMDVVPEDPEGKAKSILSDKLQLKSGNQFWVVGIEIHVVVIYVLFIITITIIIVIASRIRNKQVKMYEPEVASIQYDESSV